MNAPLPFAKIGVCAVSVLALLAASPALATDPGGANIGVSGSGASQTLSVQDAPGGSFVPFADIDGTGHAVTARPEFMTVSPAGNKRTAQSRSTDTLYVTDFKNADGTFVDRTGAHDSTTGINTALAAVGSLNHACLWLPDGTYTVSGQLTVSLNQTCVRGASLYAVRIVSTSSTADVFHINPGVNGYMLTDFTIDRAAVPTGGAGLDVEAGGYGTIERVLSQNSWYGFRLGPTSRAYCNLCQAQYNYADGFLFIDTSSAINVQWIMGHPLSQQNDGWGFYLNWAGNGSLNDTDPYFLFPNTYANTKGGYAFDGPAYVAAAGGNPATGAAHNDMTMIGPVASSDNGNGFQFVRPGVNISLTGVFAELAGQVASGRTGAVAPTHVGNGINFDTGGGVNSDVTIAGGHLMNNSYAGLHTFTNSQLARLSITGVDAHDNGQSGASSAGFLFESDTTTTILSGVMAHNQGTGLFLKDATVVANTAVSAANFTGNTTAGCNAVATNKAAVLGSGC